MSEPEQHKRYEVEVLSVVGIDPHTKKKVYIRMSGKGSLLIEPVMRKTEESPKTPKFDGNQASVVFQIHNKLQEDI